MSPAPVASRAARPSVALPRLAAPLPPVAPNPRPRVIRIGGDWLLSLYIAECAS